MVRKALMNQDSQDPFTPEDVFRVVHVSRLAFRGCFRKPVYHLRPIASMATTPDPGDSRFLRGSILNRDSRGVCMEREWPTRTCYGRIFRKIEKDGNL